MTGDLAQPSRVLGGINDALVSAREALPSSKGGGSQSKGMSGDKGAGAGAPAKNGMAQVKLRGLPYGASIQDVAAFFRGFGAQVIARSC